MPKIYSSVWDDHSIRQLEKTSLQDFLAHCGDYIKGRTLDFGCGDQRYRNLVESFGAKYYPYDRAQNPGSATKGEDVGPDEPLHAEPMWDTILCTQVLQFIEDPPDLLYEFENALKSGGYLVLTYTTCWEEREAQDLFRFTRWGMDYILRTAGFEIVRHEPRGLIDVGGFSFSLGGGVVARA